MEKIKTTLHPKDSPNDELYPNVLPSNIPVGQGLINTGNELSIDNTYVQEKLTNGVGINIDENNKIGIADSVPKQVEFSQGVKTSKIVDTNGYTYLSSDTSYINIGNSSRLLQTYGSGSRPTYNGKDLALLSDSDTSYWNLLKENLGIGRWSNQIFITYWSDKQHIFEDKLASYYTNAIRMFAYSSWGNLDWVLNDDYTNLTYADYMFTETKIMNAIYLSNMPKLYGRHMFLNNPYVKKILIKEGCQVKVSLGYEMFGDCTQLEEIGEIDFSLTDNFNGTFQNCSKLKSLHCKHFKVSFNISASTAFEESDLVEIFNNLDIVSITQTITMGTTNLAKLTTDDILIATGKGWQLA